MKEFQKGVRCFVMELGVIGAPGRRSTKKDNRIRIWIKGLKREYKNDVSNRAEGSKWI